MNKNKNNKKNGSALIISLLCLSMLGVVVLNIGGVVRSEYLSSSARYSGDGFQASYNAFSGVQYAIDRILDDLGNNIDGWTSLGWPSTVEDSGAEEDPSERGIDFSVSWWPPIKIDQDDEPAEVNIVSTGTSGASTVEVKAKITITRSTSTTATYNKYTFFTEVKSWDETINP